MTANIYLTARQLKLKSHYDRLVERGKSRAKTRKQALQLFEYVEGHHIIPICMGGPNNKDNIVYLTAREHFVAHQLLSLIYPKIPGLIFAVELMCVDAYPETGHRKMSNRRYEWIRVRANRMQRSLNKTNCEYIARMAETANVLTIVQRQMLVKMRQQGIAFKEIHKELISQGINIAYSTLSGIFRRETNFTYIPVEAYLEPHKEEIISLHDKGISFSDIALLFNQKYSLLDYTGKCYLRYYRKITAARDAQLFGQNDFKQRLEHYLSNTKNIVDTHKALLSEDYLVSYSSLKNFVIKNGYWDKFSRKQTY